MRIVGLACAAVILWQSGVDRGFDHAGEVDAKAERFRFARALQVPAGVRGQACAVLDAAVYEHTEGRLSALRIYTGSATGNATGSALRSATGAASGGGNGDGVEVPFAYSESGQAGQQEERAGLLNAGMRGGAIVFDLAMPRRTYTAVTLDVTGRDFYATAKVWGADKVDGPRTELGTYALFDLRSQGLGRSTALPLQEASFAVLHVEMKVVAAPGGVAGRDAGGLGAAMLRGAMVPPTREAQTLYTTVATTGEFAVKAGNSVATVGAGAHVPVERVRFAVAPVFAKNFSRDVNVTAKGTGTGLAGKGGAAAAGNGEAGDDGAMEVASGEIRRVRLPVNVLGQEIRSEQMSVEAVLGANLREAATVEVAVVNGDDAALPLRPAVLEMRERRLCFDAEPGETYTLRYGDAEAVRAPVFDYARLFHASSTAAVVVMGAEVATGALATVAGKSYMERHPELLWVALLAVIAALGTVALHNAKSVGK